MQIEILKLVILALGFSVSPVFSGTLIVDGDTLDVDGVRYRINGIDAPEVGQKCKSPAGEWRCGRAATDHLARLINRQDVRCDPIADDGRGRVIASCYVASTDLGAELVRSGYAWAFVRYSDIYVKEESEARSHGIGIWQGESQTPWDYRAERWKSAEQEAPAGCPIKGNISKNGMIYHPPWSPWYSRTRINKSKGERWFCSEEEAVAAGWRAPRWR